MDRYKSIIDYLPDFDTFVIGHSRFASIYSSHNESFGFNLFLSRNNKITIEGRYPTPINGANVRNMLPMYRDLPRINVSQFKKCHLIANDIKLRMLPKYTVMYNEMSHKIN